ncbi:MAG: maleylpyruvate isomerase family mycothiol-dependent enzyme [Oryzihumus sp.]
MTLDRVSAVKAERDALVDYLHTLTDEEWALPSRCEGWTVKDVVAHMGAAAHGFFTPWVVGLIANGDVEAHNDRDAEKRRSWEPKKVLAEYEKWSKRAGVAHAALQKPGLRGLPIRLAEVGVYPAQLLTSAIVFDSGLHLRHDIATAVGREAAPTDANRIGVTLEWMLAGLPTMSKTELAWLDRTVELNLVGPGGGTWAIAPGKKGLVAVTAGQAPDAATSIEGDAATFAVWGTRRQPWRDAGLSIKGDEDLGTRFLDAMRII